MSRTNINASDAIGMSLNPLPQDIINNDQGFFKNDASIDITRVPIIDLAYLSNVSDVKRVEVTDSSADVTINLNPISLKWCDFTTLFFRAPGGAFWINPSNSSSLALTMLTQTYETTQNKYIKFSLQDQIRKAWSKKNSKNEASIPPNVNILLNRAGFLTKSLTSVKEYCLGLSVDEVISALLNNNEILPGNSDTTATIKFIVSYKNYFAPLNTYILINFAYITKIPCYKNNTDCFIKCSPYSNDCENCSDKLYYDNTSLHKTHTEIDDDLISTNSTNSKNMVTIESESTNGSNTIDELSQILKAADNITAYDNDDASTKWSTTAYNASSSSAPLNSIFVNSDS
jgi:hypothetical protein